MVLSRQYRRHWLARGEEIVRERRRRAEKASCIEAGLRRALCDRRKRAAYEEVSMARARERHELKLRVACSEARRRRLLFPVISLQRDAHGRKSSAGGKVSHVALSGPKCGRAESEISAFEAGSTHRTRWYRRRRQPSCVRLVVAVLR